MPLSWHGDPHGGNIYIDKNGNIGFLDMGLVFYMTPEDAAITKKLFLYSYFGLYNQLYDCLKIYLKPGQNHDAFRNAIRKYCNERTGKPISSFFMDIAWICLDFEIEPPRFLFEMAKAFVCLNGADSVYNNQTSGFELLKRQIDEYLLFCIKSHAEDWMTEIVHEFLQGGPLSLSDVLIKIRELSNIICT